MESTKKRSNEREGKMMKEGTVKKEEGCGRDGCSFYKGRAVCTEQEAAERMLIEGEDESVLLGLWKVSAEDIYPRFCSVH